VRINTIMNKTIYGLAERRHLFGTGAEAIKAIAVM